MTQTSTETSLDRRKLIKATGAGLWLGVSGGVAVAQGACSKEKCEPEKAWTGDCPLSTDEKKSPDQRYIEQYHCEMLKNGHDMFCAHAQWHAANPAPSKFVSKLEKKTDPDRWKDNPWGGNFLRMHHKMIWAESPPGAGHISIRQWYQQDSRKHDLPSINWNYGQPLPIGPQYTPDLSTIPSSVLGPFRKCQKVGSDEELLELLRRKDSPVLCPPVWFSRKGKQKTDGSWYTDSRTGHARLGDFRNENQLGCALSGWHSEAHVNLGGALTDLAVAIADPAFYFVIHWIIDEIYRDFIEIDRLRNAKPRDAALIEKLGAAPTPGLVSRPITDLEREQIKSEMDWAQRTESTVRFMQP